MSNFVKDWWHVITGVLGVTVLVVTTFVTLQGEVKAQADSQETLEQRTTMIAAGMEQLQENQRLLQEIHITQNAKEQGEEAARKAFCRAGKLPEEECVDLGG